MNWRFAYAIGFHPWEDTDPPFARKISELVDREETGREPPYGPALDLGTGSGIWGIQLVKRGWQVTGIDIVDNALRRARVAKPIEVLRGHGHGAIRRRNGSEVAVMIDRLGLRDFQLGATLNVSSRE